MTEDEDREMDTDALIGELIAQESNRLMEQAGSLAAMVNLLIGVLASNIVTVKNLSGINILPGIIKGLKKAVKEFEAKPLPIKSIGEEQASDERYH